MYSRPIYAATTLLVLSATAYASPVVWTINNALLQPGFKPGSAVISGSFTYDADSNVYSNWSVTVSNVSSPFTGVLLTPVNSYTNGASATTFAITDPAVGETLIMPFVSSSGKSIGLTDLGGSVNISEVSGGLSWGSPPVVDGPFISGTVSATAVSQVTISGTITFLGKALSGATVTMTGASSAVSTTNSSGAYSLPVGTGGTYTLVPSHEGYIFVPPTVTFTGVSINEIANFQAVVPSDFNHDGHPDVIWEEPNIGWAQIWYLSGTEGVTVSAAANVTKANPWQIVGVGDFNGDGNPDIVWQNPANGAAQVWFLGGAGGNDLIDALNITTSNTWHVVSVADFNQDGHPDVLWQDPTSGFAQIWYLGGAQGVTLLSAADLTLKNSWRIVGTGDFNNDGFPDVVWQDPATGRVQIWYMGGTTAGLQGSVFQFAENLSGPTPLRVVAIADFNQDGHPDVVFQDPVTGAATVFFYNGPDGITPNGSAVLSTGNPWFIAGPH